MALLVAKGVNFFLNIFTNFRVIFEYSNQNSTSLYQEQIVDSVLCIYKFFFLKNLINVTYNSLKLGDEVFKIKAQLFQNH